MTLEFHKLTQQIEQMSSYLAAREDEAADKLELAWQIMEAYSSEEFLPLILERVADALAKDAGYRGARPIDEPIMNTYPPAQLPPSATILATDGSQIAPNPHGAAFYYLINTGTIVLHHGSGEPPEVICEPFLYYEDEHLRLPDRGPITGATVAARRTVAEMSALAEQTWLRRGEPRPLVALLDNPLLPFGIGKEVPERDELQNIYLSAISRLLETRALLAGYTDRPRSRYVVGLLHLLSLEPENVNRTTLATDGRLEGLEDKALFHYLLRPGERSALFVQMSPLNKEFKSRAGETHEIAFFYLNTAAPGQAPTLARVEIPMWVAEDRRAIAELQALLYHQCHQVASRYPYVLTRAHELALIKSDEARQLNVIIEVAMARYGVAAEESEKQLGKAAVGRRRTRFEVH